MNVFDVCPECKSLGIRVKFATVQYHIKKEIKESSADWFCCSNSTCSVGYFVRDTILYLDDISTKFWYKDQGKEVPICYCSDIRRIEVHKAVDNGCTTIKEVRDYLGKNDTGECELKNPVAGCCHKVFQREIVDYMNKDMNKK